MKFVTVDWKDGKVVMIDQRRLPEEEVYLECADVEEVASAIRDMVVRGAPALGVSAAFGMALASLRWPDEREKFFNALERDRALLAATRPTARNLFWALDRMVHAARSLSGAPAGAIRNALLKEACAIRDEDLRACRSLGRHGAELVPDGARILTHCNAGGLATAGYGTALGVIRAAFEKGKRIKVFADETRPFLQGSRLTAWELMREGIDVTVITDNMAGYLMKRREVDLVIVGADRITANGDVANKIGTYSLAVLARHHRIPFYVAAPLSTFDLSICSGDDIPIEERSPEEVTCIRGFRLAPEHVKAWNPAFDVTPARLVSAIIFEEGVLLPPYKRNISKLKIQ